MKIPYQCHGNGNGVLECWHSVTLWIMMVTVMTIVIVMVMTLT